jgi:hypothetical protein
MGGWAAGEINNKAGELVKGGKMKGQVRLDLMLLAKVVRGWYRLVVVG